MVNIIAFYLPQYHQIPENDAWWGNGFTDWTNVRKAKPIFNGHEQPKIPLNNWYYDLSYKENIIKQAGLANKYHIYGFCFYHYYFYGKRLLERPLELILQNNDININFCLSWANEPWTRRWDGLDKEVLMPQYYGGIDDWERHYKIISRFFKDKRYIKVDEKPMFLIYRSVAIPDFDDMIEFWDNMCIKDGYAGIHIVETINSFQNISVSHKSEALVQFEPTLAMSKSKSLAETIYINIRDICMYSNVRTFEYEDIWKYVVKWKPPTKDKKIYYGAFVNWDNTARKNKKGTVIIGYSDKVFKKYLMDQINKADRNDSGFIFINAWNEWAEGAYLEPDIQLGYNYLESIRDIIKK